MCSDVVAFSLQINYVAFQIKLSRDEFAVYADETFTVDDDVMTSFVGGRPAIAKVRLSKGPPSQRSAIAKVRHRKGFR